MGKMAVTNVFQNVGCHTLVGRLKNATFKPFYRGCPGLQAPQRGEKCQNPMWCTQPTNPPTRDRKSILLYFIFSAQPNVKIPTPRHYSLIIIITITITTMIFKIFICALKKTPFPCLQPPHHLRSSQQPPFCLRTRVEKIFGVKPELRKVLP